MFPDLIPVVRWVTNISSWNFEKINNPLHCPFNGLSDDSLKLDSFPVCRLKSDEIYLGWQKAKPSGRIRFRPYASYPRKLIAHLLLIRNLSADDVTPISAAGRRWVSWNTTLHVVLWFSGGLSSSCTFQGGLLSTVSCIIKCIRHQNITNEQAHMVCVPLTRNLG